MIKLSKSEVEELARYIVISHTEDIEYMSVIEITDDQLDINELPWEEKQELWSEVDATVRKAKVTVTFE